MISMNTIKKKTQDDLVFIRFYEKPIQKHLFTNDR